MASRESKDSTIANGNVHSTGKTKGKPKISRNSSNTSLGNLAPEAVDAGIAAVRQIAKILSFVQGYDEEISDVESVYGIGIRQQAQIDELQTTINNLAFRKNEEMVKLQDENNACRANARQHMIKREKLEQEQASMNEAREAMQLKMESQKNMEIKEAEKRFSDQSKSSIKHFKEEHEKQIQVLNTDRDALRVANKELEEKHTQVKKDSKKQKEISDIDKRSCQSHIMHLESKLDQINAASKISPQTPEFYIDGFRQLWEKIEDVAVNDFRFLPEETNLLDSDTIRDRLFSASAIFRYPALSTESAVAVFLRACAIQNFLSMKTISIIQRRYFAKQTAAVQLKSAIQPMDSILHIISNVPAETSSQDLSWQLTTVEKLDRLGSESPLAPNNISTEPNQGDIIEEILDLLHYFQSPGDQALRAKLMEITNMAIKLWRALRKDNCRVDFNYDPSTGDLQEWNLVDDMATNGILAADPPGEIPVAQLPSRPFMLFPRITGSFPDLASPLILHAGSALPHSSPAFREGLLEIKHIDYMTKEFNRSLRRGASAQTSPVMSKG